MNFLLLKEIYLYTFKYFLKNLSLIYGLAFKIFGKSNNSVLHLQFIPNMFTYFHPFLGFSERESEIGE